MKVNFEQKLFPLPYGSFKTIKHAIGESTDNKAEQFLMCLNSLNTKLFDETITGYHGVQNFNEQYDVEIIIRLKEISGE